MTMIVPGQDSRPGHKLEASRQRIAHARYEQNRGRGELGFAAHADAHLDESANVRPSKVVADGGRRESVTVRPKAVVANEQRPAKGPWRKEEDDTLRVLVEKHGQTHWSRIARTMKTRNGKLSSCAAAPAAAAAPAVPKLLGSKTFQSQKHVVSKPAAGGIAKVRHVPVRAPMVMAEPPTFGPAQMDGENALVQMFLSPTVVCCGIGSVKHLTKRAWVQQQIRTTSQGPACMAENLVIFARRRRVRRVRRWRRVRRVRRRRLWRHALQLYLQMFELASMSMRIGAHYSRRSQLFKGKDRPRSFLKR